MTLVVGPVVFCVFVARACMEPGAAAQEAGTAEERGGMGWQHSEVICWPGCGPVVLEHRKASGQALSTDSHQN